MADPERPAARFLSAAEAAIKIIAVSVPVLYAIGRAYHEGYWRGIGLSPTLMPGTAEDYLYTAFVAIVNALASFLGFAGRLTLSELAWVSAILTSFVILVLAIRALIRTSFRGAARRVEARLRKWRQKHKGMIQGLLMPILAVAFSAYSLVFAVFTSILVVVLTVAVAYEGGKARANETRVAFSTQLSAHKAFPAAMARVSESDAYALVLQCSDQWCVVFDSKGFQAVAREAVGAIGHFVETKQGVQPPAEDSRIPETFIRDDTTPGMSKD